MNPVDPQAPRALYLQLADELRAAIRRGDIRPGDRLPSEQALAKTHGVSQTTVRLALGALKAEALIASGHGRGTFVRAHPAVRLAFRRFSPADREPGSGPFKAAAARAGLRGEIRLTGVERQTADAELAHRLGIEEGGGVIVRSRHMLADGRLIQIFDAFYPLDLFADTELEAPTLAAGGIYGALGRLGYHPEHATEEVSARAPTPEEIALLQLGTGIPVLRAVRTTYESSGRALEVSELIASSESNVLIYEGLPVN